MTAIVTNSSHKWKEINEKITTNMFIKFRRNYPHSLETFEKHGECYVITGSKVSKRWGITNCIVLAAQRLGVDRIKV